MPPQLPARCVPSRQHPPAPSPGCGGGAAPRQQGLPGRLKFCCTDKCVALIRGFFTQRAWASANTSPAFLGGFVCFCQGGRMEGEYCPASASHPSPTPALQSTEIFLKPVFFNLKNNNICFLLPFFLIILFKKKKKSSSHCLPNLCIFSYRLS